MPVQVIGDAECRRKRERPFRSSLISEAAFGPWVRESAEVELIARSLIGAAAELLVAYVRGELPLDRDGLVLNLCRLFLRARPILAAMAAERSRGLAGL